jgi:hypothetical protein
MQEVLHRDLPRLVEIIVSGMVMGDITAFTPQDPRLALLREAFHLEPATTWSIFSDYLLRSERELLAVGFSTVLQLVDVGLTSLPKIPKSSAKHNNDGSSLLQKTTISSVKSATR